MSWQDRFCSKHPRQKLTVLFSSIICDLCDPPREQIDPKGAEISTVAFVTGNPCKGIGISNGVARDSDYYIVCQKCWKRFWSWTPSLAAINGTKPFEGTAYCKCGSRQTLELISGDRLETSQMQFGSSPDYEWNGTTFVPFYTAKP